MPFLRRSWPWLLVILFPLLPLWRAVFLGEAIGPFDQIRQMAPWNGAAPDRPFDVLQADAVLQFYPWRDMVFEAWGKGELPLWNPYQLAGTPLLANSQSGGFYPPHILMGVLHVPTHWAITLLAWFHLALAGLGVMALARRLGAAPEGGAIGGILFSGSAFMLAWTALPSVISTVAWIPWVLAGVYGLFGASGFRHQAPGPDPYAQRPAPDAQAEAETPQRPNAPALLRSTALIAFSTGMMLLAGHLQFAAYGLFAAGVVLALCFAFALADKTYRSHRTYLSLALGIFGLSVGAGLAAPQLLPVLEYSKFSHRRNVPTEEGYQAYVAGAIAPFELVGLVYPTAVGLPFEFAPEAKPLSQYWPALVKQGANFAEGAIGIGPLALFGLLMFPWRRAPKRLWVPLVVLGAVAFLLALGTVLNKPLYFMVPGWSSTGSPGRIGVLFVMGAAVLAGVALTSLINLLDLCRRRIQVAVFSLFVALGTTFTLKHWLVNGLSPRFPGMDQAVLANAGGLDKGSLISAIVSTLFVVTAWYAIGFPSARNTGSLWSRFFLALLGGLVHFQFFIISGIPTSQPLDLESETLALTPPNSQRAAFINEPWELVVAAPATMPPNTASIFRIPDLAGYDSLLHKDTHLFLGYVNGQDPAPPANGNMQFVKPSADPQKLREAGVDHVFARRPLWAEPPAAEVGAGLYRHSLGFNERVYVRGRDEKKEAVIEFQDGFSGQRFVTGFEGSLIVKDRLMPGWKAHLDGKEIAWQASEESTWKSPEGHVIQLWREVEVPPSRHTVEFRYEPPGMKAGFLIFIPCLLLTAGALIAGRGQGARSQPTAVRGA